MTNPEDETYIERIKQDDPKALEQLFQKYYYSLCHFAKSFVKSPGLSEEIVSDVFLNIWQKELKIQSNEFSYERGLEKLRLKIVLATQVEQKQQKRLQLFGQALRIAASLLLIIGIGYIGYYFIQPSVKKGTSAAYITCAAIPKIEKIHKKHQVRYARGIPFPSHQRMGIGIFSKQLFFGMVSFLFFPGFPECQRAGFLQPCGFNSGVA